MFKVVSAGLAGAVAAHGAPSMIVAHKSEALETKETPNVDYNVVVTQVSGFENFVALE